MNISNGVLSLYFDDSPKSEFSHTSHGRKVEVQAEISKQPDPVKKQSKKRKYDEAFSSKENPEANSKSPTPSRSKSKVRVSQPAESQTKQL